MNYLEEEFSIGKYRFKRGVDPVSDRMYHEMHEPGGVFAKLSGSNKDGHRLWVNDVRSGLLYSNINPSESPLAEDQLIGTIRKISSDRWPEILGYVLGHNIDDIMREFPETKLEKPAELPKDKQQ